MRLVAYAAFYILVAYVVLDGVVEAIGRIRGIQSTEDHPTVFICVGFIGVISSLLSWTDDLDDDEYDDDDDLDREDIPEEPEVPVKIHKVA